MKFLDQGKNIRTARDDRQTIQEILATAESKGWDRIKISGSQEFKQQMWLEAESRGIATKGYKPSPEDLALLEKYRTNPDDIKPTQQNKNAKNPHKKAPFDKIKRMLKNIIIDIWDWWDLDLNWLGKLFWLLLVIMPSIFIVLANIFDKPSNLILEIIHAGAGISILLWAIMLLFWIAYMFETPQRRRKLYLIIMAVLWLGFGYVHFFGEDPDIQYRVMMMAVVGSIWLIIPLFLSMFRPIVYYRDGD